MIHTTVRETLVPDTAVSEASRDVASTHLSPGLFNHSQGVYLWAAARGTANSIILAAEFSYVAAMLHNIGR